MATAHALGFSFAKTEFKEMDRGSRCSHRPVGGATRSAGRALRELSREVAKVGGRPPAVGLYGSVMMVVCLMRKNVTQEMAG